MIAWPGIKQLRVYADSEQDVDVGHERATCWLMADTKEKRRQMIRSMLSCRTVTCSSELVEDPAQPSEHAGARQTRLRMMMVGTEWCKWASI